MFRIYAKRVCICVFAVLLRQTLCFLIFVRLLLLFFLAFCFCFFVVVIVFVCALAFATPRLNGMTDPIGQHWLESTFSLQKVTKPS